MRQKSLVSAEKTGLALHQAEQLVGRLFSPTAFSLENSACYPHTPLGGSSGDDGDQAGQILIVDSQIHPFT